MKALRIRTIVIGILAAAALALVGCSSNYSCTEKDPCNGTAPAQASVNQCNSLLSGACGGPYQDLFNCAKSNLTCVDGGATIPVACDDQKAKVLSCCLSNLSACAESTGSTSSSSSGTSSSSSTNGGPTSGGGCATASSTSGGTTSSSGSPVVTTFTGNGHAGYVDGTGGPAGTAEFLAPTGVTVDGSGNVYVADSNRRLRKVDHCGNVTTLAGDGNAGFGDGTGGPGGTAEFISLAGVSVDGQGNVFVADSDNNRIRKVDPSGNVTTWAGNGTPASTDGTGGPTGTAAIYSPSGVAADGVGNVFFVEPDNNKIRKIDASGNVTTLAGTAQFDYPTAVAVDGQDNLFVVDSFNYEIRKIDPSGNVTTVAGTGAEGYVDGPGGPSGTAQFSSPTAVAVDGHGNVFVSDSNRIRKIDPSGNVTTYAGDGNAGFVDGPGGPSGTAEFSNPGGITVDGQGNVFLADRGNNSIRMITP